MDVEQTLFPSVLLLMQNENQRTFRQENDNEKKKSPSFALFSNNLLNCSVESITKLENLGLVRKVATVKKKKRFPTNG